MLKFTCNKNWFSIAGPLIDSTLYTNNQQDKKVASIPTFKYAKCGVDLLLFLLATLSLWAALLHGSWWETENTSYYRSLPSLPGSWLQTVTKICQWDETRGSLNQSSKQAPHVILPSASCGGYVQFLDMAEAAEQSFWWQHLVLRVRGIIWMSHSNYAWARNNGLFSGAALR